MPLLSSTRSPARLRRFTFLFALVPSSLFRLLPRPTLGSSAAASSDHFCFPACVTAVSVYKLFTCCRCPAPLRLLPTATALRLSPTLASLGSPLSARLSSPSKFLSARRSTRPPKCPRFGRSALARRVRANPTPARFRSRSSCSTVTTPSSCPRSLPSRLAPNSPMRSSRRRASPTATPAPRS